MTPITSLGPLEGFVVGITADRRWEEQAELLRRRGATVVHGPCMDTQYLADDDDLRRATVDVIDRPPDVVVATTGIGVRAWLETAEAWGMGPALMAALGQARILARGPKAAGVVLASGLSVWARSETEQMDDVLAKLVADGVAGRRVALQEYGMESPEFIAALEAAGATVVRVPVYRWRYPADTRPALTLVDAALNGRVDAITFTSAPAVRNLFMIAAEQQADGDLRRAFNHGLIAACVGPVCAQAARDEGIDGPVEPKVGRLGLLVRALSDDLAARSRTFTVGGKELVVQGSAISADGDAASLSGRERAVLEVLAARPGVVVDRAILLERIWGSADVDPHLLEVVVGRLRRRLGRCSSAIEVTRSRGYRLVVDP
ncbi:MAG: uroporphyrinogen-III synthase [Actinomycetota bacterium]|jgi:uroporphyrinogen-III synthase|nr:uroporphyrinogen-III synthase [Actinomycetota bacterium]